MSRHPRILELKKAWQPEHWKEGSFLRRAPKHYIKFKMDMLYRLPKPVHWTYDNRLYQINPVNNVIDRIENRPFPLIFPKESHEGLWGGEGVIRGFQKRHKMKKRVPHWWVPNLKKSVVYSEILDKYMQIMVTERALQLIDESYGLDFYLLKTPAVDLQSNLALHLRRKLLIALANSDFYHDNPEKHEEIRTKYKDHILPLEEAQWHGLTEEEAYFKQMMIEAEESKPKPLKQILRKQLIEKLKAEKESPAEEEQGSTSSLGWISKLNPFNRKPKFTDEQKS